MTRQFFNSQEFPITHPAPTITFPRINAPGRISVSAPIHAGPMTVACAGNFIPCEKYTSPSTVTPAGTRARVSAGTGTDAASAALSAGAIAASQVHGAASAGKNGAKILSEPGSSKRSEAFIFADNERAPPPKID